MTEIPVINVIEPSAEETKREVAGIFVRKDSRPRVDAVKERLREIRARCRQDYPASIERLKEKLTGYGGVKVATVSSGAEAAAYIDRVAGKNRLASMNKSNVLINEVRRFLEAAGLKTYLRYFNEFKNFDKESFVKKVEDYWSLPGMHGRGLVESFAIRQRLERLPSSSVRDYTAILGVNAVSAEDGSVFFLQHMSNISKDLEQAKRIVLVATVEKVLEDRESALFHTRAMGIFGLESILLDLEPRQIEKYDFDELPVTPEAADREVHLLILDNGRTRLGEGDYRDLLLCIDCRACARQCPVGLLQLEEKGMVYSPKNYLLAYLQRSIGPHDTCLHCGRCQVECPVDIDLPTLLWKAQAEYYGSQGRSWKKRMLDDPELLAKLGCLTAPLSNWAMALPAVKVMMQLFSGIHRNAHLPVFHRKTFRSWFNGGARD